MKIIDNNCSLCVSVVYSVWLEINVMVNGISRHGAGTPQSNWRKEINRTAYSATAL